MFRSMGAGDWFCLWFVFLSGVQADRYFIRGREMEVLPIYGLACICFAILAASATWLERIKFIKEPALNAKWCFVVLAFISALLVSACFGLG